MKFNVIIQDFPGTVSSGGLSPPLRGSGEQVMGGWTEGFWQGTWLIENQ